MSGTASKSENDRPSEGDKSGGDAFDRKDHHTDTHRFNQFIWDENERLNRLIRNLYLQFQLKHFTEAELYDRICEEVATYFQADSCELFLVRYQEKDKLEQQEHPGRKRTRTTSSLKKFLELAGASGPWRRALRQKYIRQKRRPTCEIPFIEFSAEMFKSSTRRGYASTEPESYLSTYSLRRQDPADKSQSESYKDQELEDHVPRQHVWRNDGLYNTFRSLVAAPLIRESKGESALHQHVGVIKVENRAPDGVSGFAEVRPGMAASHHLFFGPEWSVAALRPYVRDLLQERSKDKDADPYEPLINDDGWQQYFEDHPAGAEYFEALQDEFRLRRKSKHSKVKPEEVTKRYERLERWLRDLVECLVRLETWLQHLRHACHVLCGLGEAPTLDRPIRSLFNVYNFRAAYLADLTRELTPLPKHGERKEEEEKGKSTGSVPPNDRSYKQVLKAFLNCLVGDKQTKKKIRKEAFFLTASEVTVRLLSRAENASQPTPALESLTDALESLIALLGDVQQGKAAEELLERVKEQLESVRPKQEATNALIAEIEAFSDLVRYTLEKRIEEACETRVAKIRKVLESGEAKAKDVIRSDGKPPEWKLADAIDKGILQDLREISGGFAPEKLSPSAERYELCAEESEIERIATAVKSALAEGIKIERIRDAVRIALGESPDDNEVDGITAAVQSELDKGAGGIEIEQITSAIQSVLKKDADEIKTIATAAWNAFVRETVEKAAGVLANATMFADAFNHVDKNRLVLIASHVTQILDNHLLYQARQRNLDIKHESLGTLALDPFGLELLDRFVFLLERIRTALDHLIQRQADRQYEDRKKLPEISSEAVSVADYVSYLEKPIEDEKQRELELLVLRVNREDLRDREGDGARGDKEDDPQDKVRAVQDAVIGEIRRDAGPLALDFDVKKEERDEKWLSFKPRQTIGAESGARIEIRLDFDPQIVMMQAKLVLLLPSDALGDVKCLWAVVKMLEDLRRVLDSALESKPDA